MSNETYFTFQELVRTDTGLPNYPLTSSHLVNLTFLWDTLDSVREKLGRPVFVNSAFRTPAVNKQVGGVESSKHLVGRAADIRCEPLYMDELFTILKCCEGKGPIEKVIKYSTFYHIEI